MWSILEIFVFVLELLTFLPRSPNTEQRSPKPYSAPNWVRWSIYGVILMGVMMLALAGIALFFA
jgi:hypothetical protein